MLRLLLILLAVLLLALGLLALGSCAGNADLPVAAGTGPDPVLPAPRKSLLPLVNVAKARGWDDSQTPIAADGLAVTPFAAGLDHPRWLYVLPNGDVLVAETNAQQKPPRSLYDRLQIAVMKRAGAGVKSADRISLLRDTDGDGIADMRSVFLSGLTSPFGMALIEDRLYVANTDGIVSFPYSTGDTEIATEASYLAALPAGELNHHWTKSLVASTDGRYLYAGWVPTAIMAKTAWTGNRDARRSGKSRSIRASPAYSLRDYATRLAWTSNRRPERYGPRSMSAMTWAATWCRIT